MYMYIFNLITSSAVSNFFKTFPVPWKCQHVKECCFSVDIPKKAVGIHQVVFFVYSVLLLSFWSAIKLHLFHLCIHVAVKCCAIFMRLALLFVTAKLDHTAVLCKIMHR